MTTFTNLTLSQMVAAYNQAAVSVGMKPVNKFKDRDTAERRLTAIQVMVAEFEPKGEETKPLTAPAQELVANILLGEHGLPPVEGTFGADVITQPAAAPKTETSLGTHEEFAATVLEKMESAAKPEVAVVAPTPDAKTPRWARPKHEAPAAVAYLPKPGSVQATAYYLLTQAGGVSMTDFCSAMRATKSKDSTLFTPSAVWSALRYLFCAMRGYGLDFDGTTLRLLVPADERSNAKAK